MANIKNYKSCPINFCASSHHFRDITISNLLPSKSRSRSRSTIFARRPFDGKYEKVVPCIFALILTDSEILMFHFFILKK